MREEQRRLNKDQDAKLPLLPFQPADVLPDIHNGETQSGVLGAGDIGTPAVPSGDRSKSASPGAASTPLAARPGGLAGNTAGYQPRRQPTGAGATP